MQSGCFLDTNLLLYAATGKTDEPRKFAVAESVGAGILYTEDLNHGQRYGSVLVQNPFRDP